MTRPRTLQLVGPDRCPTCLQPLPSKGRVCSLCDRRIRRSEGWHIVGGRVLHRVCPTVPAPAEPTEQEPPA